MNGFVCLVSVEKDDAGSFVMLRSVENPSHQVAAFQLHNPTTEGPLTLAMSNAVIRTENFRAWLESAVAEKGTPIGGGK